MDTRNSSSSAERKQDNLKASLKKALFVQVKLARIYQKNKSCRSKVVSRAAAIARANSIDDIDVFSQSTQENDRAVRLKIVVMKEDLKQALELMRNFNDKNNNHNTANNNNQNDDDENGYDDEEEDEEALLSMDERLIQWRKNHRPRHNCWNPTLQTIPEEILA